MPRSFIAVHQTLGDRTVDGGNSSLEGAFCCTLVAGLDRREYFLDGCTDMRALAGITQTMLFGLTCTLTC